MDREHWNERYRTPRLVWSAEPNRFLRELGEGLAPGRALDLACGEGRNAIWLARRGWTVTGVDFAGVGLEKARRHAAEHDVSVDWIEADLRTWQPPAAAFDLVALLYLHLPADELDPVLRAAATAVAPGGTLFLVGHDRVNIEEGVGGPQNPAVLYTPEEIVASLDDLEVERAERVTRDVEEGTAIDALVEALRPGAR
jgi:2-polyprenyl-3-methyl-5-hydroxy-6-metoxy-1,4-benzoquinol methylase